MKDLNIVTLNVPYPPDYGGMIDSYYRIKWLKQAGITIHLHCFEYGRKSSHELESLCKTICFYPRHTGILSFFSSLPYIVKSRDSNSLLENLKSNDYPILFDGLHTTYFLNDPGLISRKKFVRIHNIEHLYYKSLAYSEKDLVKKLYFWFESRKLLKYEKRLGTVNLLTISEFDYNYFTFLNKNAVLSPPFHQFDEVISKTGSGKYILYHGDLSVSENSLVARSLVKNVFSKIKYKCIIAGKNPRQYLCKTADKIQNIRIIANPDQNEMEDLIRNAHINLLPASSSNGFKLKHLISLYSGRFCIVNSIAAINFPDKSLFHIADSEEEMIVTINQLMEIEFSDEIIRKRKILLGERFSNKRNTHELVNSIFP
ncbi:MAG TPA: glycosyltransferase [Bacteroidales bacterium]|nr:glycosyltransferase [Bacteroidales bacterium]